MVTARSVKLRANGQQFWELLHPFWQWRANAYKQRHPGIQTIRLSRVGVMRVRGPNNVGRAVQTDPTLVRYASVITEQKKCCDLFAQNFNRFQTLHKNSQQHATTCSRVCKRTQHVTFSNVGSCWPTMLGPFSRSKGQEHS